jgi:preprotein translocase subunit YajC
MAWPDGSAELALALHRGSAVMTLALTATVVGLVMWFLLTRRIARIEQHEAEMLLNMHRKGESDV